MIQFDGLPVLPMSRSQLIDEGVTERHALHAMPGFDGERVVGHGQSARVLKQKGVLVDDTIKGLQNTFSAVEMRINQSVGLLEDGLGRSWDNVVLLAVLTEPYEQVGLRYRAKFEVQYIQMNG